MGFIDILVILGCVCAFALIIWLLYLNTAESIRSTRVKRFFRTHPEFAAQYEEWTRFKSIRTNLLINLHYYENGTRIQEIMRKLSDTKSSSEKLELTKAFYRLQKEQSETMTRVNSEYNFCKRRAKLHKFIQQMPKNEQRFISKYILEPDEKMPRGVK